MTDKQRAEAERLIRAVVQDRVDALRAKDAARVVAQGAEPFRHFSLAPPLIDQGGGVAGLTAWFATWDGALGYEIRDLTVVAGEDVGFAHGLAHMTGSQRGKRTDLWFRVTLGFRKVDGAWKVVHEHESVPFYMDGSYKAAIDLKP